MKKQEAGISEKHASNFVASMRRVSKRHSFNLPIPSEYRSVKRTVLDNLHERMLPIKNLKLSYPKDMFSNVDKMKKINVVYVDLMLVVADQMMYIAKTGT